jgi:Tol biopolymer transport system component
MASEGRERVEEVFSAALEREPGERAAFVERACGDNPELRHEVESLLGWAADGSLVGRDRVEVLVREASGEHSELKAGENVGRYQVLGKIGEGGMGEVYLARDASLGRRVALKLLPASSVLSRDRLRRFEQEAYTTSNLNHPNIVTIYEIGQAGETHFIAAEYVEGKTLREWMNGKGVKLVEALDISIQIASALAAAHRADVVHRDIKPENVMLRPDGIVKVLDFGLAKLSPGLTKEQARDPEGATEPMVKTEPGVVMGTVAYMSPEQSQAQPVDTRTDIWSFGVVLYEMVTGHLPFEGSTGSHMIVSILEKEPPPLTHYWPEVPAEFQRIVRKMLRKDREERYQTVKDLALDLKNLRRELEAELDRSGATVAADVKPTADEQYVTVGEAGEMLQTGRVGVAYTTSSAEYLISEIKRHKKGAILFSAICIVLMGGVGYGLYRFFSRPKSAVAPFQTIEINKLTHTGKVTDVAISPDGKYVAHVVDDYGQKSLWIRHISTGSSVQIVPPADSDYRGITFSSDGNYIYYVVAEKGDTFEGVLYQVPVLGGVSRKLLVNILGPVTFSPDGKRLAFVRLDQGDTILMLANADGSGEQSLASRKAPNSFIRALPVWSPDGKNIACPARTVAGFEVIEVHVEDGRQRSISSQKWEQIGKLAWLSDSSGLVMIARDQASASTQIWQLSYPGGEARRITNDTNDYRGLSLTVDSRVLVTVQSEEVCNLWIAPGGEASRARQITSGTGDDGMGGVSWTPDGRIVYRSTASGTDDLWSIGPDGDNPKKLTTNGKSQSPSVSPDGRYVVFASNRLGNTNIWRMDIDGSNLKQLTGGRVDFLPQFSPDGRWVVYTSLSDTPSLWKVSIDGGQAVRLTDKSFWARSQAVSADGKQIAISFTEQPRNRWRIALIPFEGGQPTKIFKAEVPVTPFIDLDTIRWTPDSRAVTYIDTRKGISNIWEQPLDGGSSKQLTNFQVDQIFNFDWSRDGKWLALARGSVTDDIVLIEDAR